jgi:hypothetical protein
MISEAFALAMGALMGAVGTAGVYRSGQAINVRRAVANVMRYLNTDSHKPLGEQTKKLRLNLELINEADDLVTRSEWARKHKRRFVLTAVDVIKARAKGVSKENKSQYLERVDQLRDSGEMLLGYLQFPSILWLKASLIRAISRWR